MKGFYGWAVGFFVFFYIKYLFTNLLSFANFGQFDGTYVSAFLFGLLVAFLPSILKFFKINNSNGALLLGGVVVNFAFYFIGYYILKLFTLNNGGVVAFLHPDISITVQDQVIGLILISLVSSAIIVGMQALAKK